MSHNLHKYFFTASNTAPKAISVARCASAPNPSSTTAVEYSGQILASLDPTSGEFVILPPWFAAEIRSSKTEIRSSKIKTSSTQILG